MPQNTIRKIAVVFVTDFVGFSKTMGRNSIMEGFKKAGLKNSAWTKGATRLAACFAKSNLYLMIWAKL